MGGLCGGMAEYYDLDPTIVRMGAAVFALIFGAGVVGYLIACLVIPSERL